jgi:hypothetical protein
LERRAIYQGKDVTSAVAAANALGLAPWKPDGYDEQVKALSRAGLAALRRAGLVQPGEDDATPQWTLRTRYYWQQRFPAGAAVRIRHRYRPFVGSAVLGDVGALDGRTVVGRRVGLRVGPPDPAAGDRYCLDAETRRALAEAQRRTPKDAIAFSAAEIEYVLTTARNWRGPIGRFHLTLDKGAPDNLISVCRDGLKKTGATIFESTVENFVPGDDIHVLVLVRAKPR